MENKESAKYTLSVLKTQPMIVCSWGINPKTIKVIDSGIEFHVQGFKHTGPIQIILNEGKDLFEIHLIKNGEILKTIENVFVDELVSTIDFNVEYVENYGKRISEEYGFLGD